MDVVELLIRNDCHFIQPLNDLVIVYDSNSKPLISIFQDKDILGMKNEAVLTDKGLVVETTMIKSDVNPELMEMFIDSWDGEDFNYEVLNES